MCGADPSTAHSLRCALLVVRGLGRSQSARSYCLSLVILVDRTQGARATHMAGAASPRTAPFPQPVGAIRPPAAAVWLDVVRAAPYRSVGA